MAACLHGVKWVGSFIPYHRSVLFISYLVKIRRLHARHLSALTNSCCLILLLLFSSLIFKNYLLLSYDIVTDECSCIRQLGSVLFVDRRSCRRILWSRSLSSRFDGSTRSNRRLSNFRTRKLSARWNLTTVSNYYSNFRHVVYRHMESVDNSSLH